MRTFGGKKSKALNCGPIYLVTVLPACPESLALVLPYTEKSRSPPILFSQHSFTSGVAPRGMGPNQEFRSPLAPCN